MKKNHCLHARIIMFLMALWFFTGCFQSPRHPYNLRISHLENPLGYDDSLANFSWQLPDDFVQQSAWQVLVASHPNLLTDDKADVWNSGKIKSSTSAGIAYQGERMESGKRYFWKVRIWEAGGKRSRWSETAWWETGLLKADDWKANWICAVDDFDSVPPILPAPYFRREFDISGTIASARLYISGLGYYEAFINGSRVDSLVLNPVMTRYDRRVKYLVHDVTEMIGAGKNVIGVVLGNGWYNQHTHEAWDFDQAPWRSAPALLAQLEVTLTTGEKTVITSDNSWKFSQDGPIRFDGVHNGETYDARMELRDWAKASFNDQTWANAFVTIGPAGFLSAQLMPSSQIIRKIEPVSSWKINDSVIMYDLGENITGWAGIKLTGPAGAVVKLRYGERIFDDRTLDQKELQRFIFTGDTQTGRYILKGEGEEQWHPRFTYHGFQYVEATLSDPSINLVELSGHIVHTHLQPTLEFSSSNPMFNRIHQNLVSSFLGNYHGYPTDCPHREKMGWTGDAMLVAEAGMFNFDMMAAYKKWIDDFIDEQQPNGQIPGIIPTSGWGYQHGRNPFTRERGYGPQWEGALIEIPWQMYRFSGDLSIISRYFLYFKKYVDYLYNHSENYLLNFGIDDHKQLMILTGGDFLSSAHFYRFANILTQMAELLGNQADASHYRSLADSIKISFNKRYFDETNATYSHGGQTPVALALNFGLVPNGMEEKVLQSLLNVIAQKDGHIDAGVVGTKAVINALLQYHQTEVLYQMVDKRTFPGWGYWIEEFNATTLYQNWDGTQSRNHIMFGSVGDYFYKGLAGIRISDSIPGFFQFIIRPSVPAELDWVEASYDSPRGVIKSAWEKGTSGFIMRIQVPGNTKAQVFVPGLEGDKLKFVQGKAKSTIEFQNGYHVFTAEPGSYEIYVNNR